MTARKLSILHLSATDNEGGSGRSAYRIHRGLRELGHQSRMLVGRKVTRDADVDTVHAGSAGRWGDYLVDVATRRAGLVYQWLPTQGRVARHPWLDSADVFQLFNIHGGHFVVRMLASLGRRAPIVWRLSDMWAMTGRCVYPGACERWLSGCGQCPDLGSYVETGVDTSAWLWRQKKRLYEACNITVVAPSSWTEAQALRSPLLGRFPVQRIPNGLDTRIFRPIARDVACDLLGLAPGRRRILFVAHGLDANPRKGGEHLAEALRRLGHRPNWELLLAGVGGESWRGIGLPIPIELAGYVTDDRLMAAVYSSADLIVLPSVVENLPNTLLEAMACGVPGVAFDAGGMCDAVRHMETGYLARYGDAGDLATGIERLLGDPELLGRLGKASLRLVADEFTQELQARRFDALYQRVVAETGN